MTTRKDTNGYIITDFTEEQKQQLLKVEVPNWIIHEKEINEIKKALKIDEAQSVDELRAIRNSAVLLLRDYVEKETGRHYMNLLTGTTAVIDQEMMNRFNTL